MSRNVAAGADALEADLLVLAFVHSQPIWLLGVTGALLPRHPLAWRLIRRALLLLASLWRGLGPLVVVPAPPGGRGVVARASGLRLTAR